MYDMLITQSNVNTLMNDSFTYMTFQYSYLNCLVMRIIFKYKIYTTSIKLILFRGLYEVIIRLLATIKYCDVRNRFRYSHIPLLLLLLVLLLVTYNRVFIIRIKFSYLENLNIDYYLTDE